MYKYHEKLGNASDLNYSVCEERFWLFWWVIELSCVRRSLTAVVYCIYELDEVILIEEMIVDWVILDFEYLT